MALDASSAAKETAIARRDPFLGSMVHARMAVGHSYLGNSRAARRHLGYAEQAFGRVDHSLPRPNWSRFYCPAELYCISAVVHDRIGDPVTAEAYGHQALAILPDPFRRNRALATIELALAQLHQKDVEQACCTATTVFDLMPERRFPGRLRSALSEYHRGLKALAPRTPAAREWTDRRNEWR